MRLYADGCRVQKHVRLASSTRGSVSLTQEQEEGRRIVLVARVSVAGQARSIPPLYDATLAGISGESLVLMGYERLESGPMRKTCLLGQKWLLEPAVVQDLIDVEVKWTLAIREANELREQLRLLTEAHGLPSSPPAGL